MNEEVPNRKKLSKSPRKQIDRSQRLRQEMPPPELLIWQRLRPKYNKEFHFRRQTCLLGNITVDFYLARKKIAFEIDGKIHDQKKKSDSVRDERLRQAGVTVVRISARRVFANPDGVAELIRQICLGETAARDLE